MDNKIIRFYNQNRILFWTIILTVVAVIVLIHILNNFVAKNNQTTDAISILNTNSTKADTNYFVISERRINLQETEVIYNFLNYCNNGEVEKAYELLSSDCKEILYPSLNIFTKNYYNRIFNTKKLFRVQALIANGNYYTYQIDFTEDILETGKIDDSSIIDYYTIVENNRSI